MSIHLDRFRCTHSYSINHTGSDCAIVANNHASGFYLDQHRQIRVGALPRQAFRGLDLPVDFPQLASSTRVDSTDQDAPAALSTWKCEIDSRRVPRFRSAWIVRKTRMPSDTAFRLLVP